MSRKRNKSRRRRAPVIIPRRLPAAASEPAAAVTAVELAGPVHAFVYGDGRAEEHRPTTVAQLRELRTRGKLWLDIDSLGAGPGLIAQLGEIFGLHALALEDVVHVHQRPKVDDYDDHAYIVVRMPELKAETLELEQVSIFVGRDYVVTVGERPGDCLEAVRQRLRQGRGRLCRSGADYLAYAIVDAIVDAYSPVVERYNERLETLEATILERLDQEQMAEIHAIRHELFALRRLLIPTREAIGIMGRGELSAVGETTRLFLRDCHDHVDQLLDAVESCRELGHGLMELHMYGAGNRLAEVMKVLTLIGSIFIPLHFIAGVYGMNFDRTASPFNMPELGWTLGYPFALGLMASTAIALLLYFRSIGWLRRVPS
jgi:magnesium transporter